MAVLSPYEDLIPDFLVSYPIGSNVTGNNLVKFVENDVPDNHRIKRDLDEENPLARIKRHLAHGARSGNLPEAQRFVFVTVDAKRQLYRIEALHDHANALASAALLTSVTASMKPFKAVSNEINTIKIDELTDEQRRAIETASALNERRRQPVAAVYLTQIKTEWRDTMKTLGIDAATADRLLTGLPQYQAFTKMLAATGQTPS